MKKTINIKWVVAHDPLHLFVRTAEYFQTAINAKTDKYSVNVEILTPTQYADKYGNGTPAAPADNDAARVAELSRLMDENNIQMSQMVTTNLAQLYNKDMHVLDMPFLFSDHDHAQRVFEGDPGKFLLEGLTKNTNMRGLAFTYSGGFRCIPANGKFKSLADLVGKPVRAGMNHIARDTFAAIGTDPISIEAAEIVDATRDGRVVASESVFPRIYPLGQDKVSKSVLDTQHSLFLTTIVVNDTFWNSLDPELQVLIAESAIEAARMERQASIDDAEEVKKRLTNEGVEIIQLSAEDRAKFKEVTAPLYDKYRDTFAAGLLDSIKLH